MTDYVKCPYCQSENKVQMYENYEDACSSCNKQFNVDVDVTFAVTKPYCHKGGLVHQLKGVQMMSKPGVTKIYCCVECGYYIGEGGLESMAHVILEEKKDG